MSFEKSPKCVDDTCTPYSSCKVVESKTSGKQFRACLVCNNLVFPPKLPRCADNGCDTWEMAASSAFDDSTGTERRKCSRCLNLVFQATAKNAGYKRPSPPESDSTAHIQIGNLNTRVGLLEQSVAQILANMKSVTR
jgi:hypothetical protein